MNVLVAVDFGDASLEALREARLLAHEVQGKLAAVHVLPAAHDLSALFPERSLTLAADFAAEEQQVRTALVAHAREKLGLELSEVFVERGSAYAEIVRRAEAWNADYVTIGTHGRTGIARMVLGSVAERVARHAHCSVLVARPVAKPGIVLAATDLSDASLPAVREAALAARRTGAKLVVLSVLEWASAAANSAAGLVGVLPALPPPELQKEVHDALRTTLANTLAELGVQGEARVAEGSPAAEIVRVAEELSAELVVIGARGRTGLLRLALGGVAERVVRSAPCSVLAVRSRG